MTTEAPADPVFLRRQLAIGQVIAASSHLQCFLTDDDSFLARLALSDLIAVTVIVVRSVASVLNLLSYAHQLRLASE